MSEIMNKSALIESIDSKRAKNKATLNSLNFNLISDSSVSKGQNADGTYNVEYSKTGYFITSLGGQLIASRAKNQKQSQDEKLANLKQLYIGNIYPNDFELNKLESSGLIWSDAQKDREWNYIKDTYSNLTEDEQTFLENKMEVWTSIDAKTLDFLKTRTKDNRIIVIGRYDFSKAQYNATPPSQGSSRQRRGKASENVNQYWDRINISLQGARFLQLEEFEAKGKKMYNFIDISSSLEKAAFKLEAEQLAKHLNTKVKFANVEKSTVAFENKYFLSVNNGFKTLKNANKEVMNIKDYEYSMATNVKDFINNLKDNMIKNFNIQINKNNKEGVVVTTSTVESRNNPNIFRKTELENEVFYSEYIGKLGFNINKQKEDGSWVNNTKEVSLTAVGTDVRPNDYRPKEEREKEKMPNLDATNHVAIVQFNLAKERENDGKYYVNGKKTRTNIFFK